MKIKIISILSIFLTSFILKAQNFDRIKEQNVFFVLMDKKDKLAKFGYSKNKKNPNCDYYFFKKNKVPFEYGFSYSKYPTFDDIINNLNKTMVFRMDKSFIRKNKDIIITREFMEKMGKNTILDLLYSDRSNKTIFMINTAETKNGKIILREVTIDYTAEE